MSKVLVLAGAGHAHLHTLANVREIAGRGHPVVVVSSSPVHYYSGMGPGMLSGFYRPADLRFDVRRMAESAGASFIAARVVSIDPAARRLGLDSGASIDYDLVSFNLGSIVPAVAREGKGDGAAVFSVKPIENLERARVFLMDRPPEKETEIVVIGGGPAGVEVAANVEWLMRSHGRRAGIALIAGARLLPNTPSRVRRYSRECLEAHGVRIVEGERARSVGDGRVDLEGGERLPCDVVLVATGVRPERLFEGTGVAVGEDGALRVDATLRSVSHPEIFGGGDGVVPDGGRAARVGVHAVRQGPVLFSNLSAVMNGGELVRYVPPHAYLQIMNLGEGIGIAWKYGLAFGGRLAFLLKDRIDRRFMRRYGGGG